MAGRSTCGAVETIAVSIYPVVEILSYLNQFGLYLVGWTSQFDDGRTHYDRLS